MWALADCTKAETPLKKKIQLGALHIYVSHIYCWEAVKSRTEVEKRGKS